MLGIARSGLFATVFVLLAGAADAAIPVHQTLHSRVLDAGVILVARLTADGEYEWPRGARFKLEVREILTPREGESDTSRWRLDSAIPGSSMMGGRHPAPTDVDVVVFANRLGDLLVLLPWCCNSIVPLRETLTEVPGPGIEKMSLPRAEFLTLVRRQIARMRNFDDLVEARRGAIGSMHPFCAQDRASLLVRILALSDERVPAFARKLWSAGVETRERDVLLGYFAREPDGAGIPLLRERFLALLMRRKKGEMDGHERFSSAGWSDPERPRDERILDVARALHGAGDGAFVRGRLLPVYRDGFTRAGRILLRLGEEEALRTLAKRATAGNAEAVRILVQSRERSGVLAAVRAAFAADSEKEVRAHLRALTDLRIGPGITRSPGWVKTRRPEGTLDEIRAQWQAWWRGEGPSFTAAFAPDSLDRVLGPDPEWQIPVSGVEED